MSAVLILPLALVALAYALTRRRTRRDPLESLGPLPADWRPRRGTVVQTHHLTGGASS